MYSKLELIVRMTHRRRVDVSGFFGHQMQLRASEVLLRTDGRQGLLNIFLDTFWKNNYVRHWCLHQDYYYTCDGKCSSRVNCKLQLFIVYNGKCMFHYGFSCRVVLGLSQSRKRNNVTPSRLENNRNEVNLLVFWFGGPVCWSLKILQYSLAKLFSSVMDVRGTYTRFAGIVCA